MLLDKIDKKTVGYTSEIDRFLAEFDRTHKPTPAQLAEIKKYKQVYKLRDQLAEAKEPPGIWEKF